MTDRVFKVHDRVYIINKVTSLTKGRATTELDRKLIVTSVLKTKTISGEVFHKVHIKTDSGRVTWRLIKNLNELIEEYHKVDLEQ